MTMEEQKVADLSKAKVTAAQPGTTEVVPVTRAQAVQLSRVTLARLALKETYRSENPVSRNKEHFDFYYGKLETALGSMPPT